MIWPQVSSCLVNMISLGTHSGNYIWLKGPLEVKTELIQIWLVKVTVTSQNTVFAIGQLTSKLCQIFTEFFYNFAEISNRLNDKIMTVSGQ